MQCRDFVDSHTQEQITGVVAHEIMHVVMRHHMRIGERDKQKWNKATDYAINDIVVREGFVLPDDALLNMSYANMSAEKVYEELGDDHSGGPRWGLVIEPKGESGESLTEAEKKAHEASVSEMVAQAEQTAKAVGKMSARINKIVSIMQKSQVSWTDVLRRFVSGDQPDDYTFKRPNRKALHMLNVVMPSADKIGVGNIVVAVDTSGSVSVKELMHFLGELNAISEDLNPESITVITHDTDVRSVVEYQAGEIVENISLAGRGGTCVAPVFKYIEDNNLRVDSYIHFSDMMLDDIPPQQPDYPVLWVSSYEEANVPSWGEYTILKMEA